MNKIIIIILVLVFPTKHLKATGQYGDLIIEGKDTFELYSNPLEIYLENKGERTINGSPLFSRNTACHRGYLAIWKFTNDSLYLVKLSKGCVVDSDSFNLESEFGSKIVFANWFNGSIRSPRGEIIQYVHGGYGNKIEKDRIIEFKNGISTLDSLRVNLEYDSNLVYPNETSLRDTLQHLILTELDSEYIKMFSDSSYCIIDIIFNENQEIEEIQNRTNKKDISFMEKTILDSAKNGLKDFPRLMTVKSKYYQSPYITIYFNPYCLKNPWDKEYGCK